MLQYIEAVNKARTYESIGSDSESVMRFIAGNGTHTSVVICGLLAWDELSTHAELVAEFGPDGRSGTYASLPIFMLASVNLDVFCVATFSGRDLQCASKTVFKNVGL